LATPILGNECRKHIEPQSGSRRFATQRCLYFFCDVSAPASLPQRTEGAQGLRPHKGVSDRHPYQTNFYFRSVYIYNMSLIEKIGIGNVLNSILVNENVRPAMLVQPADYNEATGQDPKTKSIKKEIIRRFPELLLSEDYNAYQGVIISKTNYNGQEISLEKMGEILGYPCSKDFDTIDDEKISYSISIYAKHKNNQNTILFPNICKDKTNISKFESYVDKAKKAFHKDDYKDILNGYEVEDVYVKIDKIVPTQEIINKLLRNETLEQNEIDKIQNILFNLGFSMEIQFYFLDHFQYKNPIHIGILLSLLLNEKNNILLPFTPLQDFPTEQKELEGITKTWEKDLLILLRITEIHEGNRRHDLNSGTSEVHGGVLLKTSTKMRKDEIIEGKKTKTTRKNKKSLYGKNMLSRNK
jgi:hypothetical protein